MAKLKMFLSLFVVVAGLYSGVKIAPAYFYAYQFQDAVKDEATRDSYAPKSEEDIQDTLYKKAQELEIPIKKESIKVVRQGNSFSGTVIVHAAYVVHVDLPEYPLDLHFDASTENKGVF
jgi:hypothetical protein